MVDPHDQVDVDRADHDDLTRGHTGYRPNSRVHRSSRKRSPSASRATAAFGSPHGSGMCQNSASLAAASPGKMARMVASSGTSVTGTPDRRTIAAASGSA